MSKPEWGAKRTCQGCGAKFYDFGRMPIVCPRCSAVFDPEILLKSRRTRTPAPAKPSKPVSKVDPANDDADVKIDEDDDAIAELPDDDDDDDGVIEDASELGEDDEEMSDVVVPAGSEDE